MLQKWEVEESINVIGSEEDLFGLSVFEIGGEERVEAGRRSGEGRGGNSKSGK